MRIESEIGVSESDTFSDFFLVQVVNWLYLCLYIILLYCKLSIKLKYIQEFETEQPSKPLVSSCLPPQMFPTSSHDHPKIILRCSHSYIIEVPPYFVVVRQFPLGPIVVPLNPTLSQLVKMGREVGVWICKLS